MNKIFFFVMLLASTLCLGQNALSIGVEVGPSLSNLRGDVPDISDPIVTLYFAATFEYRFSEHFSFKSGLGIEKKGNEYNNTIDEPYMYSPLINNEISMLTIPLLLKYSTAGKFQFYVNAGPFLSYLTKGTGEKVSSLDYGITSGVGFNYKFSKNNIYIEMRNSYGLANIYDSDLGIDGKLKTNAFYLVVGYSHQL